MSDKKSADGNELTGKYLTFVLGSGEYAIGLLKVQQVIQMQPMTRIPKAPKFINGLVNLRGKVIPTLNLHSKFSMQMPEQTSRTCIVIVEISDKGSNLTVGIIFDEVKEVMEVTAEMLTDTPAKTEQLSSSAKHIVGAFKVGKKVRFILDLDEILSVDEVAALRKTI
ncbi:MAG: chemotaxis protein CheW [Chitinivibrionia bacterium]|jgi:purine-binding chemotaxis protein CheW|nr:chemotaxis protein CheW [Chitinivibrionia bacterium]